MSGAFTHSLINTHSFLKALILNFLKINFYGIFLFLYFYFNWYQIGSKDKLLLFNEWISAKTLLFNDFHEFLEKKFSIYFK